MERPDQFTPRQSAKTMSERKALPSASSFGRYAVCPGSFLLELEQPEESRTPDAERGTLIHEALAGGPAALRSADEDTRDRCLNLEELLLARAGVDAEQWRIIREERLWMHDPIELRPLFSGKPDGVAIRNDGGRAVVWDFKTGREPVEPAELNWQLRAQAVLVRENYGVTEIEVAIIQPWVTPSLTLAQYDREDLESARTLCLMLAALVTTPGRPRNPTERGCKFCRAKAVCPELVAMVPQTAALSLPPSTEAITPARMAQILPLLGTAKLVIKAVETRAKAMLLADPQCIPGWRVIEEEGREQVEDALGVWMRLREQFEGAELDAFISSCTTSKEALSALLRKLTGQRGRELKTSLSALLAGFTKRTKPSVTLEKVE